MPLAGQSSQISDGRFRSATSVVGSDGSPPQPKNECRMTTGSPESRRILLLGRGLDLVRGHLGALHGGAGALARHVLRLLRLLALLRQALLAACNAVPVVSAPAQSPWQRLGVVAALMCQGQLLTEIPSTRPNPVPNVDAYAVNTAIADHALTWQLGAACRNEHV